MYSLIKHTSIKKKPSTIPAASSLWKKVDNEDTLCKFALSIPSYLFHTPYNQTTLRLSSYAPSLANAYSGQNSE